MSKKKIREKVLNFFYKGIAFKLSQRLGEINVLDSDKINLLDLEACHEK